MLTQDENYYTLSNISCQLPFSENNYSFSDIIFASFSTSIFKLSTSSFNCDSYCLSLSSIKSLSAIFAIMYILNSKNEPDKIPIIAEVWELRPKTKKLNKVKTIATTNDSKMFIIYLLICHSCINHGILSILSIL